MEESTTTRPSRPRRAAQASRRPSISGHHGLMDLSWKDGGSAFPKRASRVGSKYQATDIPSPGSIGDGSAESSAA